MEYHTLLPFYDSASEILILGSFPSVKSREENFYYAHPQNRFWKVLSLVFLEDVPKTVLEKKEFLKRNHIALFDVCASCLIKGSSDASISKAVPNDLSEILNSANIKKIYTNGNTAYNLYNKLIKDKINREAILLPSTSPANARYHLEDLVTAYQVLRKY